MKGKFLIVFIVIVPIGLCITFYLINQNSLRKEGTIDLVGTNKYWGVSLNIQLNYNSQLIIRPRRDNFSIPPEINIDIIVNDNSLYTDTLEYIADQNNNFLVKYIIVLDSNDYFNKDTDEVQLIIRYDNEISTILLN